MRSSVKLKIDPLLVSKVLFLLYIVYNNVTSYSLFFVRGLSSILLLGSLIILLYHDRFKLLNDISLNALILFVAYIFASGLLVSTDFNLVVSTATTFLESLLVFYIVIRYIGIDGTPSFVMSVFIIQAIVAASIMIFRGSGVYRVSIADNVNVNTLGVMFAFAIGFTLFIIIQNGNPKKFLLAISIIVLMLFGIMMTASKKAILAAAVFIVLWIIFCYKWTFAKMNKLFRIGLFIVMIAVSLYVYKWFTGNYVEQLDYVKYRMSLLYVGESDQARTQLIKEGFSIFLSHPIFGVGFNNARYYTSLNTYTHCFYSEILACTGLIGAMIFGYALFRPAFVISSKLLVATKRGTSARTQIKYMNILLLTLLSLCLVQILFYTPTLMYVFAIITGFAGLGIEKISSEDEKNE